MTEAILQAKLEKAAHKLWEAIKGRCAITLVACYSKESSGNGHAWVTTLGLPEAVDTIEAVLLKWRSSEPVERDPAVWVPEALRLPNLAELVRNALPFAVISGLLFGSGKDVIYVSFADRLEMQEFFEDKLLPHLREQLPPQEVDHG